MSHWLAGNTLFGCRDKIVKGNENEWCIAKIQRLVGPLGEPAKPQYSKQLTMGNYFEKSTFVHPDTGITRPYIQVGTIRQELEKLPSKKIDPTCLDFIESLLVINHTKRPTAKQALQHCWTKDLDLDEVD